MNTFQALFADKLITDDRIPSFSFTLMNDKSFGLLVPKPIFYAQIIVIFFIQLIVAIAMAIAIYHIALLPQKAKPPYPFLIGFGVVLPLAFYEPVWIIDYLSLESIVLKLLLMTLPLTISLRCLEAMFGFTPEGPKKNLVNYIIYASCLVGCCFDPITQEPFHFKQSSFYSRLRDFFFSMLAMTVLCSSLAPSDYVPFDTESTLHYPYHFMNMLSVNRLMNSFILTLTLSTGLNHSTMGVGLIFNIVYQVQTLKIVQNPMFSSKSPSDFWGRKWNTFIHSGLKGGIFKPLRMRFSTPAAVLGTFLASGLLHEYCIFGFYHGTKSTPSYGKNMIFFGWNAVLILLESIFGRLNFLKWIARTFPRPLISIIVILTALPLGHLFLDDWVESGYFHHYQMGLFIIIPLEN